MKILLKIIRRTSKKDEKIFRTDFCLQTFLWTARIWFSQPYHETIFNRFKEYWWKSEKDKVSCFLELFAIPKNFTPGKSVAVLTALPKTFHHKSVLFAEKSKPMKKIFFLVNSFQNTFLRGRRSQCWQRCQFLCRKLKILSLKVLS